MIRAVVFDLGGTLHQAKDSKELQHRFASRLVQELAGAGITISCTEEELMARLAENAEAYKHHSEETLREDPPEVIWADWYLKGFSVSREQILPIAEKLCFLYDHDRLMHTARPNLVRTLRELNEKGIQTGIISNIISTTAIPRFVEEYKIAPYISCLVMSSSTGIRKPDPAIFRIAEKELGRKPEELCYVGDTISRDVIGTRNAGWAKMIRISEPSTAIRDAGLSAEKYQADYDITDLSEIPGIIQRENEINS
jgi:putative hydrolase of the HAD superfamily